MVKITKTTICGTDLHILKGDVPTCKPGTVLGHEGVGIVDAVGAGVTTFKPADVKAVRGELGQSQVEFALMIGVSVSTLRNWEQGRRTPDGPALALLRVAAWNPEAVVEALHRGSGRGAA